MFEEEVAVTKHTVVIITPNGTAKFTTDKVNRGIVARMLFGDWRKKNHGEYIDIITRKFTKEEREKFPVIVDMKDKISEVIGKECELFIDGVTQDVDHLMNKYWNQLNHK